MPGWGAIHWPRGLTKLTQITAIPMCVCVHVHVCVGEEVSRGGNIHSSLTPNPKNLSDYNPLPLPCVCGLMYRNKWSW